MEEDIFSEENSNFIGDELEQQEKEKQQEKKKYFYDDMDSYRSNFSDIHLQNSYNTGSGNELEQQEKEEQKNEPILQTVSRYKLFGLFGNYSKEEMQNSYFPKFFFSEYDAYEFKTLNNNVSNKNLLSYNKDTGLNF